MTTRLEAMTIDSLLQQLMAKQSRGKLDLNPVYQRNVVWDESMMIGFIDSIIRGYVPNNIIINKGDKGHWVCIDGKQRLTSILKFYQNEIPRIIENSDENVQYVYFNKVPKNCPYDKSLTITLSDEEQYSLFLDRQIPVASYTMLSYDIQADIFNRIQNSKVSTEGERIHSMFSSESVASRFKTFCDELSPFFGMTKKSRDTHVMYILNVMYSIHAEELMILNKDRKAKFIKYLNRDDRMKAIIEIVRSPLKIIMAKNILRSKRINSLGLRKNFLIAMIYLINEYYHVELIEKADRLNIIDIVTRVWNQWNDELNKYRNASSDKAMSKLENMFDTEYNKIYYSPEETIRIKSTKTDSTPKINVVKKVPKVKSKSKSNAKYAKVRKCPSKTVPKNNNRTIRKIKND